MFLITILHQDDIRALSKANAMWTHRHVLSKMLTNKSYNVMFTFSFVVR